MKVYKRKDYSTGTIKAFRYVPDDKELKENLKHIKSSYEINENNELEINLIPATKTKIIVPPNVVLCIKDKQDGTFDYFTYGIQKFSDTYIEVKK